MRSVLERDFTGRTISAVHVDPKGGPLVVRDLTGLGPDEALLGRQIADVRRRGKFLILDLGPEATGILINPKLAGRLQRCGPDQSPQGRPLVSFSFEETEQTLHYLDPKRMGQVYVSSDPLEVPTFASMGPDAMAVDRRTFADRLRRFRGEIKGVLAREKFIAGIGNAYADEILWQAKIHPYTKRPALSEPQVDDLYEAMKATLVEAGHLAREAMGPELHLKPRDFHRVHLRGGEPCGRCGTSISEIRARRRVTNFCRSCQPGGLIRGL